jgi:hypothetical protein
MAIVGAFDVHRRQVTFDVLDTDSGQVRRGQLRPACRATVRRFLAGYAGGGEVAFTVEGCTGWRFIVEELERAGIRRHLAEPAQTADARGSKRRAKTDRLNRCGATGTCGSPVPMPPRPAPTMRLSPTLTGGDDLQRMSGRTPAEQPIDHLVAGPPPQQGPWT